MRRMRVRHVPAPLFFLLVSAAGCGTCKGSDDAASTDGVASSAQPLVASAAPSTSADEDDVRPVYEDGPVDPLAKRLCEILQDVPERRKAECCGGKPMTVVTEQCTRNLSAALRAKAVTLDAADVDKCGKAIDEAYAGCDWTGPIQPELSRACEGIVKGTLGAGARCRSSLECTGDLHCAGAGPTQAGKCAKPGKDGDACRLATDALAAFTRQDVFVDRAHPECAGYCGRRTCASYAKQGEPCDNEKRCAKGLSCVDGKCGPHAAPKEGGACKGLFCGEGLMCIFGKCMRTHVKKPGEACVHPAECIVGGCAPSDGGESRCGGVCGITLPERARPTLPQKDAAPAK